MGALSSLTFIRARASVPYRLKYVQGSRAAVATLTALLARDIVVPVLEDLAERTRMAGTRRLLIDLLDVPGTLDSREHERIGRQVAQHLGHLEKIASLVPAAKITRLSERGAQACGVQLRVFSERRAAMDWLAQ